MKEGYKINCGYLGPHKELQEVAFSLGYYWTGEKDFGYLDADFHYLFCNKEGVLCHSSLAQTFKEQRMTEISPEKFKLLIPSSALVLDNIRKKPKIKLDI